jgi:hypothetical protein
MYHKKDFIIIGIVSIILAVTGFILDLSEREPSIVTNIFETLLLAGLIFCAITIFCLPIKLLAKKINSQNT